MHLHRFGGGAIDRSIEGAVPDDNAAPGAPRALVVKLAVMAVAMVGLLTAVLVIFT